LTWRKAAVFQEGCILPRVFRGENAKRKRTKDRKGKINAEGKSCKEGILLLHKPVMWGSRKKKKEDAETTPNMTVKGRGKNKEADFRKHAFKKDRREVGRHMKDCKRNDKGVGGRPNLIE